MTQMATFASVRAYWNFANSVRTERRYVQTLDAQRFLEAVARSAETRVEVVPSGTLLWRAQLGASTIDVPITDTDDYYQDDYPFARDRMVPLRDRAPEGRTNPKGIPHLYLATHRDTAVAEMRPWKGTAVTVAQFRIVRESKIVNATLHENRNLFWGKQPTPEEVEEVVWQDIDKAFSVPSTRTDDRSEYVPTQILSELFKAHDFDGVAYASAYGEGHNVALFDTDNAVQINAFVVRVSDLVLDLTQGAQSYTVDRNKSAT